MQRMQARVRAYVGYAQAHPGMYGLMFRTEQLDYSRPSLHEAARASFAGLAEPRLRFSPPLGQLLSTRTNFLAMIET